MELKQGDAVMHPARGAGTIVEIEERSWQGAAAKYYVIEMLDRPRSTVRVPVARAEDLGLRPTLMVSELPAMWEVLESSYVSLPDDHKERNQLLNDKFTDGDTLRIAEVVRDLFAWQQEKGRLTTACEQIYRRGLRFLAMELAAARGMDLDRAELQVRSHLRAEPPASPAE